MSHSNQKTYSINNNHSPIDGVQTQSEMIEKIPLLAFDAKGDKYE